MQQLDRLAFIDRFTIDLRPVNIINTSSRKTITIQARSLDLKLTLPLFHQPHTHTEIWCGSSRNTSSSVCCDNEVERRDIDKVHVCEVNLGLQQRQDRRYVTRAVRIRSRNIYTGQY